MLSSGFAYIVQQTKIFLQRQALIYGFMACGGLVFIFAIGYALDAVRVFLAFSVGGVYASLIIGGCLLIASLACIGVAHYLGRSTSGSLDRSTSKRLTSSRTASPASRSGVTSSAILAGGAVTGLVAGVLAAKRPWVKSNRTGIDRDE